MKSKKNISIFLLATILISQLNTSLAVSLNNDINNNTGNNVYDEYLDNKIYSDAVNEKLSESLKFLNLYKDNNEVVNLDKSIIEFTAIPYLIDIEELEYFEDGDVFDFIFYEIRKEVYNIKDSDIKSSKIIYLGEKLFLGWRKFKMVDVYGGKYLLRDLVEYNKGKVLNVQDRLDYLGNLYLYYLEEPDYGYADDEIPEIDFDKNFLPPAIAPPTIDEDAEENNDSVGNNSGSNKPTGNEHFDSSGKFTDYEKRGDKCYEVLYIYKNGLIDEKKETLLPKDEYVKCGIYTYIYDNIPQVKPEIVVNRDYIENNQNIFSKNSVYYTLNKNSKHPYYYNTFILTSFEDNSLSYYELKDVLYQLSIRGEGFDVSDNDKQLIVLEGKPLVLKAEKNTYTKKEIESMMDVYSSYGLKIMESSSNKCYTIETSVLNEELTSIFIDNNEVELLLLPKLINNNIFLPVNEIANHLGAKIALNKNGLRISKEGLNIDLKVDNKIYLVNNEKKEFYEAPILIDNELYAMMNEILEELGYKITWDSDFGKLLIEKESI